MDVLGRDFLQSGNTIYAYTHGSYELCLECVYNWIITGSGSGFVNGVLVIA